MISHLKFNLPHARHCCNFSFNLEINLKFKQLENDVNDNRQINFIEYKNSWKLFLFLCKNLKLHSY